MSHSHENGPSQSADLGQEGLEERLRHVEAELARLSASHIEATQTLAARSEELLEREQRIHQLEEALREIQSSRAYRLALRLRDVRLRLAPPGSLPVRLARGVLGAVRGLRRNLDSVQYARPGGYPADYNTWIENNEPGDTQLRQQRQQQLQNSVQLHLVVVIDQPDLPGVEDTLASIRAQTYHLWQLWLVSRLPVRDPARNSARDPAHRRLKRLRGRDVRIHIVAGLDALPGAPDDAYLGFVDPGDRLPPFAFFEAAQAIDSGGLPDLVYSDEDRISADGRLRFGHFFKPDWSPHLLQSCNYIHRFALVRGSLLHKAARLEPVIANLAAMPDYDLYLRAAGLGARILHIPRVLYHNRTDTSPEDPTPLWTETAAEVSRLALADHLRRSGSLAELTTGDLPGSFYLAAPIDPAAKVSILIPNRDQVEVLERCVRSILGRSRYPNYEILLIENNSVEDATFQLYENLLASDDRVRLMHWQGEFNFARINNQAAADAQGDYLLFLNNDTEVIRADWIERLLDQATQPRVGAVGARLYYPGGAIQHAGVLIGIWGIAAHSHKHLPAGQPGYNGRAALVQNFSAVTAACMLMRKSLFSQVGGFDESLQVAYNDVDLCLRLRQQGYWIVWTPFAELYHHEQLSRGDDSAPKDRERVLRETALLHSRWTDYFKNGDPFYNPNLTLEKEDYSLRISGQTLL